MATASKAGKYRILLVDDHPELAFAVVAAITLISVTVLCLSMRDSDSPGYQAAAKIRWQATTSNVVMVHGLG